MTWDKARQAAYYAEWKARNLDHWKAYQRAYYLANREKKIAMATAWNQAHPEVLNARTSAWKKRNPGKVADYEHQRRARVRGLPRERISRAKLVERDGGICHLCGLPVAEGEVSVDHLIPISKGGGHTWDNVALAHTRCNVRRGAKPLPDDY